MKRIVSIILVALLCTGFIMAFASCGEEYDEILKIYNWDDYIYDDELGEFADYYYEKTGKTLKIVYVTFDTNETMLTKVINDNAAVDVICPSEYAIQKLLLETGEDGQSKLKKINYFTDETFENAGNIDALLVNRIKEAFTGLTVGGQTVDITEYLVPYMYGTLGIMYNTDVISKEQAEDAGWGLLWNKTSTGGVVSEDIKGKIFMKDSIRDSYAAVLFYLKERGMLGEYSGLSAQQLINSVNQDLLTKAETELKAQKEQLLGYEVDLGKNDLIKGRSLVGLAWSGDAMYAIEEAAEKGVTLDYFVPSAGGNIWFDGWVIPSSCNNERAAKMFIDWLNDPVVAMQNMMEIGYTSAVNQAVIKANQDALDIYYEAYEINTQSVADMDEARAEFFDDLRRYPTIDYVNYGVMKDFGEQNANVVKMWESVRSSGFNALALVFIIVGIVIVGAVVVIIIVINKNKGHKRVAID